MVRRTQDGLIRFSSFTDIHRAVTMYDMDKIDELAYKLVSQKRDQVAATLEKQDLYEEVLNITSQALSACYSSSIKDTTPAEASIDDLRTTLLNRVRWYTTQLKASGYTLDLSATMHAQRNGLTVPTAYNKALASLKADSIEQAWRFVRLENGYAPDGIAGKSYALCHVTKASGVLCTTELGDNPDAPKTYVRSDTNNVRSAEIEYKSDKVIGLFCPAYNYDRQLDGPKRGKQEAAYSIFVTDTPIRDSQLQPYQFLSVGSLAGTAKELRLQLRQLALRV